MTKTETTTQSIPEYFYDDLRPKGAIGNQCSTNLSAKRYDEKSYIYDGDGLRISRTDNLALPPKTTYYVWDTENPTGYPQVIEEIENNQVVRRYGYGLFLENVDIWNGSAFDRFYVVRDGTNSVRMLLDSAANIVEQYDFDALWKGSDLVLSIDRCSSL